MRVSTWQLHHHHLQPSKTHFSSGRCSWSSILWDLDRALTTSMGTVYLFMTLSRLIKCVLLGALPPLGGSGHTRTPVHTHACAPHAGAASILTAPSETCAGYRCRGGPTSHHIPG